MIRYAALTACGCIAVALSWRQCADPSAREQAAPHPTETFAPVRADTDEHLTPTTHAGRSELPPRPSDDLVVTVVDAAEGRPIASAEVCTVTRGSRLGALDRTLLGTTSSAGATAPIARVLIGARALAAYHPDYAAGSIHEPGPGSAACTIRLLRLHRFTVEVRDIHGHGVPGVRIHLSQTQLYFLPEGDAVDAGPGVNPRDAIYSATSDVDGSARVRVPKGQYTLLADHPRLAWIPDDHWEPFEVHADTTQRIVLREAFGVAFDVTGLQVVAEELYLGGCPNRIDYGASHLARQQKILRSRFGACVIGVVFPPFVADHDESRRAHARLRLLVRDAGWIQVSEPLRPCSTIATPVALDPSSATPVVWGDLAIAIEGAAECADAIAEVSLQVRPAGRTVEMWRVATQSGETLRLPEGDYAIDVLDEPVLNRLASRVGVARVRPGECSEWRLRLPGSVRRCRLTAVAQDARFLPYVSYEISGEGWRVDLAALHGKPSSLCLPFGLYRIRCRAPGMTAPQDEVIAVGPDQEPTARFVLAIEG